MHTSLLKKLTLAVVVTSAFAITGCSDANSRNTTPLQSDTRSAKAMNAPADAATTFVTNTSVKEEAKRNAEAETALY